MPYSITCSTKILTLAKASLLFIFLASSLNLLWCQVCTLYCPLRKKRFFILLKDTDVHIQQHIHQKDLKPLFTLCYYVKVVVELEKTQTGYSA